MSEGPTTEEPPLEESPVEGSSAEGSPVERSSVTSPLPPLVAATDDERLERPDFAARLDALLTAGLPALLLRSQAISGRRLYNFACQARERCVVHGAELWIGDRADVMRACRAHGVQLPERGLSIAGARRAAGPGVRVGRSVHSLADALRAAADGADHLVVGTIYATASHAGVEPAGPGLLAEVRVQLEERGLATPFLAIGGVTPERAPEVARAGAAGAIAIGALWDADHPDQAIRAFLDAFGRASSRTLH